MIDKAETGARIARMRRELGRSQAELAELLNVSPQAVSKWETGGSLPDVETLLDMSWLFHRTVNEILDGDALPSGGENVGRGLLRAARAMKCPECGNALAITTGSGEPSLACGAHTYRVTDGVVDFRTREIPGETWSLSYRNYDEYRNEHTLPPNPNYARGLDASDELWREIEKRRPKLILDMACGTGQGIKRQLRRINWPVTIVMVDISHRILKWDKLYYSTELVNPFADMVYLACDGARLPLADASFDMVLSYGGFESMQDKMYAGLREAYRILKPGGAAVYTKSAIESRDSPNTRRWTELLFAELSESERSWFRGELVDTDEWTKTCAGTGFARTSFTKLYGELPAPETGAFPFRNEIAQWMEEYVAVSEKG